MKVDFSASDFEKSWPQGGGGGASSLAIWSTVMPRLTGTGHSHDVIAKLSWVGLGRSDILPARHQGTPSQMSPIGAAAPSHV